MTRPLERLAQVGLAATFFSHLWAPKKLSGQSLATDPRNINAIAQAAIALFSNLDEKALCATFANAGVKWFWDCCEVDGLKDPAMKDSLTTRPLAQFALYCLAGAASSKS